MDVEKEFRRVLGKLPAEVYIDVPETRPAEFYSIELTGTATAHAGALMASTVTVQCWAATRKRARDLFESGALENIGELMNWAGEVREFVEERKVHEADYFGDVPF